MQGMKNELGLSARSVTNSSEHCLLRSMTMDTHFREWICKIDSIPDWYIEAICTEVSKLGVNKTEIDNAIEVLLYRKTNLSTIIRDNQSRFAIKQWGIY